tara:strand:+ start:774 stop:2783 length:2010 start_codon:yes stop_codon:yes gene_type:complete
MSALSVLLPAGGEGSTADFVASGTLPNGSPVILKADGTVEVVEAVTAPDVGNISYGSEYVFNPAAIAIAAVAFDPNTTNTFIAAYADDGNGSKATAIVGTVSGTTISFGSEYVFSVNGTGSVALAFDPNTTGEFVVAFRDATDTFGTAVVGTRSGTVLSFGVEAEFNAANASNITLAADQLTAGKYVIAYTDALPYAVVGTVSGTTISFGTAVGFTLVGANNVDAAFDPNTANKVVIAYRDGNNANLSTAIVGTVSGTAISFGTSVAFSATADQHIAVAWDPSTATKLVITFKGKAIVGTVSGTAISFGTAVTFSAGAEHTSIAFDPSTAGKFILAYMNTVNTNFGTSIGGTVSGTTITFGTEVVYNAGTTEYTSVSYDPSTAGKFVVTYTDVGGSRYGTSILGQTDPLVTTYNITADNFLGISTEAYTNAQTATIKIQGGLSTNHTGLTVGSTYYVQNTGTLTTTAGTPYVVAGKAVSATSLLLNKTDDTWTSDVSAWVLLETLTADATSTIDIGETTLTSAYDVYMIEAVNITPSTNGTNLYVRMKIGGTYRTAGYNWHTNGSRQASSAYYGGAGSGVAFISTYQSMGNAAGKETEFSMKVTTPASTTQYHKIRMDGAIHTSNNETGFMNTIGANVTYTGALTGIRLYTSSGNIATGTFRLYGLKNT